MAAARKVVEEHGFHRLSARGIAHEIGYAPGTLYNMYRNLDEILMLLEGRALDELDSYLGNALQGKTGIDAIRRFASANVEFAYQNVRLWELIREHSPETMSRPPDWYLQKLHAPLSRLEAIMEQVAQTSSHDEASRSARLIWTAVLGTVQVATTPKFGILPLSTAISMAEDIAAQHAEAALLKLGLLCDDGRLIERQVKRARHPS